MSTKVLTPITQALNDGALTRKELKALMARSDAPALMHFILWYIVLLFTGFLIFLTQDHIWLLVPAMFLHGIVMVHHFSLQHECTHYTPFKTRWLNDVFGNYCGFVIMLPHRHFRYEHCDHHTYTQLKGHDPEMIELPASLWGYLYYISSIPYWKAKFTELFRHMFGQLSKDEKRFIPKSEYQTIFWEARLMALGYLSIFAICVIYNWSAPLYYWIIPVILGEPIMRAIRLTEHVGRPPIADMKENTRTSLVSKPWQFLSWNMNYHAEHHYASSVPFYALPKLHKKLDGYIHVEERGYLGAHIDIISQLIGLKPRADQNTKNNEQLG